MPDPSLESHRQMAIYCFNKTWELMKLQNRTPLQDDEMLQCVYASRFHWGKAGGPLEFARGEWQISRVMVLLDKPDLALEHARLSLMWCEENQIKDFDLAFAYEAMARSYWAAGRFEEAQNYIKLGNQAAENISEAEDRDYFLKELNSIQN